MKPVSRSVKIRERKVSDFLVYVLEKKGWVYPSSSPEYSRLLPKKRIEGKGKKGQSSLYQHREEKWFIKTTLRPGTRFQPRMFPRKKRNLKQLRKEKGKREQSRAERKFFRAPGGGGG